MADSTIIKGTKTEINLATAYVSESTAYTRYTYYSQKAFKDMYYQYANIFAETADNELHHAKIYLKFLKDGSAICAPISVDTGIIGSTADNLKIAISEEQAEDNHYLEYAAIAEQEGFPEIARHFKNIAAIEAHHKARFAKMLERIETGTVWKRDQPIKWQCLVCGFIFEGTEPPATCPACDHPYQHYMPMEDNI